MAEYSDPFLIEIEETLDHTAKMDTLNVTTVQINVTYITVTISDVVLGLMLAPVFFFVYAFVLFVILAERKQFRKPYYCLTVGLGFCHSAMLFRYIYSFIISTKHVYVFGETFDSMVAVLAWSVGWHSVLTFQIVIGINRFVAIVFFERYRSVFSMKCTTVVTVFCYVSGFLTVTPLLINHRMKYDFCLKYNLFVPNDDKWAKGFYFFDLVYSCFSACAILVMYSIAIVVTEYKLKNFNMSLSRSAFMKEVKMMLEGCAVALTMILQEVTFYFGWHTTITLTFMLLHSGMTPFIYLTLDRKLRRYVLAYSRCECKKRLRLFRG